MALTPGTRIGVYEVTAQIGAGGMGEVYRATDSNLKRSVAIKVLPASVAGDADRLARFQREAEVLAALNHPNIAAIYGLEKTPDFTALVMELVEGEDLSQRILRGAIPIHEALPIAKQIAEALETAHEQGIIHRDLKPANIKVRADGTVKVLDFGLAKAMEPAGASSANAMNSPTLSMHATQAGIILGTAAYMAPEQARGKSVDKRADIWAFGVVFYEMLTGRPVFAGDTVTDIIAAVVTREPDWAAIPAATPARLVALMRDCLVRDPKQRLRDVGDARLRLGQDDASGSIAAQAAAASGPARWLWPGLAAIAAGVAVVITTLHLGEPAPERPEIVTFELTAADLGSASSVSPNGRQVAYGTSATETQPAQLWLRSLATLEGTPVLGTAGATSATVHGLVLGRPIWSPDSRALVFFAGRSLRRVDTLTGQITELVKNSQDAGTWPGAWNRDGVILYGRHNAMDPQDDDGIWRVSENGGTPVQVSAVRAGELQETPSGFLPGGRRFLYFTLEADSYDTRGQVRVGSIDLAPANQDQTVLLTADGPAVYAPAVDRFNSASASGYLVFVSRGNMMAQPFDPKRAALTGEPIQIVPGASPTISASVNGTLVYRAAGADGGTLTELTRVDRSGRVVGKIGPPAAYGEVQMVDERRLAVSRTDRGEAAHLQIVDVTRAAFSRLNPGAGGDYAAAAAPDGTIAYNFSPKGRGLDIYLRAANGVGAPRRLVTSDSVKHPTPDQRPAYGTEKVQISVNGGDKPHWSRDGREIFFLQRGTMMAAPVRPGKPFQVGAAVALFDTKTFGYVPYAVMVDGTFVINTPVESRAGSAPPLRVMLNWQAALRK